MSKQRLLLLGCGKKKQPEGWSGFAEDLYTGSLFVAKKRYAVSTGHKWFIVSAKFGLLYRLRTVSPYEQSIEDLPPHAVLEWALELATDLLYTRDRKQQLVSPKNILIELHMGASYAKPLEPVLNAIGFQTVWPTKGMSQGQQMHWYSSRIKQQA
jgi:hypothetical protein